jgi:hypothetical protein
MADADIQEADQLGDAAVAVPAPDVADGKLEALEFAVAAAENVVGEDGDLVDDAVETIAEVEVEGLQVWGYHGGEDDTVFAGCVCGFVLCSGVCCQNAAVHIKSQISVPSQHNSSSKAFIEPCGAAVRLTEVQSSGVSYSPKHASA